MHTRSRSTILSLATLLGAGALLVGCDDPPSAPGAAAADGMAPSLAVSSSLLGVGGSAINAFRNAYYAGVAPITAVEYFGSGDVAQVAVSSTPSETFPRQGSDYLVVSSGNAELHDREREKSRRLTCKTSSLAPCDVGGLDIGLTVPRGGATMSFDFRYYSWDASPHLDPVRLLIMKRVTRTVPDPSDADGCAVALDALGACSQPATITVTEKQVVAELAKWTTASELPTKSLAGAITYGPEARVEASLAAFAGQEIILRLEASDDQDGNLDSGALIDNLRILPPGVRDWQGPRAFGTRASLVPVPINSNYTLSTMLSDEIEDGESDDSDIRAAEYTIDPAGYLPMSIMADGSEGFATASVVHRAVDVYTVCARGIDEYGNVGERDCIEQAAYDPTKTYAAASGWYQSLPGAQPDVYTEWDELKGVFGVSARYQTNKKGTTLQGAMRFQLKKKGVDVPVLAFRSKALTYLLIDAGLSRIKGTGVLYKLNAKGELQPINPSAADHSFLVTMVDGDGPKRSGGDVVRLKIWHTVSGVVVYDSQLGEWNPDDLDAFKDTAAPLTEVRGGQVKIQ